MDDQTKNELAARVLAAGDAGGQIPPLSSAIGGLSLEDGYRIAGSIMERRTERGESVVGWKIGFTNRNIWDEYDVRAPVWGAMYDTTVARASDDEAVSLSGLTEPLLEPEIGFRLGAVPSAGMTDEQLLSCIDAVTHGFEVVRSVYPGWKFQAADTVAAFAMHGRYRHGRLVPVSQESNWLDALADFRLRLFRNGVLMGEGRGADVLDSPLSALRHMVDEMGAFPTGRKLKAGDLITTGTVTRAFAVQPGEIWTTEIDGLPLDGLSIRFAG